MTDFNVVFSHLRLIRISLYFFLWDALHVNLLGLKVTILIQKLFVCNITFRGITEKNYYFDYYHQQDMN